MVNKDIENVFNPCYMCDYYKIVMKQRFQGKLGKLFEGSMSGYELAGCRVCGGYNESCPNFFSSKKVRKEKKDLKKIRGELNERFEENKGYIY